MKLIHLIAVLAAASLCACKQQETPPPPTKASLAAISGIAADGGRLVLPAVNGNPGAAYVLLANRSKATIVVTSVTIDRAAKAEIHRTTGGTMAPVERVEVAPGTSAEFKPGGLHIMAFSLDPQLQVGGKAQLTVIFADGEKLKAPLTVEPPGGAMAGMDHGDMH